MFTVRNGVQTPREVELRARTEAGAIHTDLSRQKVSLGPGEAREVVWDVLAPVASDMAWIVTATDKDGVVRDTVSLPASPSSVEERITQATLMRLAPGQSLRFGSRRALPGRAAGYGFFFMSSLQGGQDGVRAVTRISCLEQRLSRAVGLHDGISWQGVMEDLLLAYLDDDGLAKYFRPATPAARR